METEILEIFDIARKLYPDRKRGNELEFEEFKATCRKKHKDWKKALFLLAPAIATQIEWRKAAKSFNYSLPFRSENRIFIPAWKNFQTWIHQCCWEEEQPQIKNRTISGLMVETPEYKELVKRVAESFELDLVVPDNQARKVKMLADLKGN